VRAQGKDEVFLCSVSNFDAYTVARPGKSKLFLFAVKSTDNITFFENKSDYMHVFACGERDARQWIEKIMLARVRAASVFFPPRPALTRALLQSYVINQERNVIQSHAQAMMPTTPDGIAGGMKALTRSGTRKGARPAQPLLDVSAALVPTLPQLSFEPGSLLAGR
jgi:hypothetical protein